MHSGLGRVVVSGASGFVGRVLCRQLLDAGAEVIAAARQPSAAPLFGDPGFAEVVTGELGPDTEWAPALQGADAVIHLAARVHVMRDTSADPLAEFRRVNVAGTERLAQRAAEAGVKRLVYASSIKVNGEATHGGDRFTEADAPAPQDPYGISKLEAEQALHRIARETGLEVAVVRPPLVYGPGVKGNFAQMLGVVARGIPLPLASVRNLRDLVYVGNLADALIACASHPAAAGQTYLVCDGEPVSTPELLRQLAAGMGVPSRLFPCSPQLLQWAGKLAGRSQQVERLLGSLQVDGGKMRRDLGWSPPCSLRQGLRTTAEQYLNRHT